MNSFLPSCAAASCGSCAASGDRSKNPPVRPASRCASFNASSVAAAPQPEIRNARLPTPTRRAASPARSEARALARLRSGVSGIGANSPFEVESTLIGRRRPSGSKSPPMDLLLPMPRGYRVPQIPGLTLQTGGVDAAPAVALQAIQRRCRVAFALELPVQPGDDGLAPAPVRAGIGPIVAHAIERGLVHRPACGLRL